MTSAIQPHPKNAAGLLRGIGVDLFYEYAACTKVSGLLYLSRDRTSGLARYLWIGITLTFLAFGFYLVYLLATRFMDNPVLMVIDHPRPAHSVPFPALTFCHPQIVHDTKIREFVERRLQQLPSDITAAAVVDALPALGAFLENTWSTEADVDQLSLVDRALRANNYTVAEAIRECGLGCEDFLVSCSWSRIPYDCFEPNSSLGFGPSISYLGMCCSLNYYPENAQHPSFRATSFGPHGGLTVIGSARRLMPDGRSGVIFSRGFMTLMHRPFDYAVEGNQLNLLEVGAVTSIGVYVTLTNADASVLALSQDVRHCVEQDDLTGATCAVRCTREFVYTACGCHPFYLPRPLDATGPESVSWQRECDALDAVCFARNYCV